MLMLISSGNTLIDTSKKVMWASLSPVKMTRKINHHRAPSSREDGHVKKYVPKQYKALGSTKERMGNSLRVSFLV